MSLQEKPMENNLYRNQNGHSHCVQLERLFVSWQKMALENSESKNKSDLFHTVQTNNFGSLTLYESIQHNTASVKYGLDLYAFFVCFDHHQIIVYKNKYKKI